VDSSRTRVSLLLTSLFTAGALAADIPEFSSGYVPPRHPFRDATLFVDGDTAAANWQAANNARWLDRITRHPQARWLNNPEDIRAVPPLARQAARDRALLVLVAYYVPNRDCAGPWVGAPTREDYDRFVDGLIDALGPTRAVVIMEPDAVAADCFDPARARLLRTAVQRLTAAGHYVYLDAGHPTWRSIADMARRLRAAGITHAEGFSVNVANRRTTRESYQWARRLSSRVGNREFVIDTSRNGLGPPPGHEWCNPDHEALGEVPTTEVERRRLAALLWIKPPGESDGACGGEVDHHFSPRQAENLVRNAPGR
jgi:endoglucanase